MQNDEELMRRVADDDDCAAFAEIVERYERPLYSLAFATVGDRHEAEDRLQETFLAVWKNRKQFRGEAKVRTWFYRILWNKDANWLRNCRRRPKPKQLPVDICDRFPQDDRARNEDAVRVRAAMLWLEPEEFLSIALDTFQYKDVPWISAVLGLTQGIVQHRHRLGYEHVRTILSNGEATAQSPLENAVSSKAKAEQSGREQVSDAEEPLAALMALPASQFLAHVLENNQKRGPQDRLTLLGYSKRGGFYSTSKHARDRLRTLQVSSLTAFPTAEGDRT